MRDVSHVSCLGYCRVSLERQAGEVFTSLDDQKRAITTYAAKLGHSQIEWFVDAGASGGTMDRDAMLSMLASCERSPRSVVSPGLLLVLNSSRWSRMDDPEEAAFWRVRFRHLGWIVRYAEHDEVEDTTIRTVMRAIGDAQSSEYRKQIKNNAKRGAKGAASQGFWRGRAPYGYRRAVIHPAGRERVLENGTPKAPDEKVVLVPHVDEAPVIRMMFESYASGTHSFETLARHLRDVAPRIKWCAGIVGGMLRNPAYLGDVVGGRRLGGGRPGNARMRPAEQWYGKPDAHEAIVDRATFAAVQSRLVENTHRRGGVRSIYVVSGLIHCNTCGRPMVGGGLARKYADGRHPHYYRCSSGLWQREICPGPMGCVMQHLLEGAVIDKLGEVLARPSVRVAITRAIDEAIASCAVPPTDARRSEIAYEAAVQRRDRIVAAVANGTLTDAEAASQLIAVRRDVAVRDGDRQRARFPSVTANTLAESRDAIVRAALDFRTMAKKLTGPALREVVRPWIESGRFDKTTRYLYLNIRCIPMALPLTASPGTTGRHQIQGKVVTCRVRIGGAR